MSEPEARVHVGWYCDHTDEPKGEGTHMSSHGRYKKKRGWIETFPEPGTQRAMSFLDYHDPAKPPHCKKAIPLYIDKES